MGQREHNVDAENATTKTVLRTIGAVGDSYQKSSDSGVERGFAFTRLLSSSQPPLFVEGYMIPKEIGPCIQPIKFSSGIDHLWTIEPTCVPASPNNPWISRLQCALADGDIKNVVMVWDHYSRV